MVEVEKRSFITKDKYDSLIDYFKSNKYDILAEKQITTYFKGDTDFRLMNTPNYLKLWLKKGKLHDDAREEMEVIIDKNYEQDLKKMLDILGYEVSIKWYRTRIELTYKDFKVTIDYSISYGYIVEFELLVDDESKIEAAKESISMMFKEFNIDQTPKEVFDDAYNNYKINWESYTKNVDDNIFLTQ